MGKCPATLKPEVFPVRENGIFFGEESDPIPGLDHMIG